MSSAHSHPMSHVATEVPTSAHPAPGTTYTCPMHPEVISDRLGSCPKCGMALEFVMVSFEYEVNPEFVDMTRCFCVCVALVVPLFLPAMSDLLPRQPLARLLSPLMIGWLEFVLATPIVLWGGWPF